MQVFLRVQVKLRESVNQFLSLNVKLSCIWKSSVILGERHHGQQVLAVMAAALAVGAGLAVDKLGGAAAAASFARSITGG